MSSVAGAKKQPADWRGAPADYSLYAPVPHQAEDFWALADGPDEKILRWFMRQGKRQPNDAWVCGQYSYADISRGTRLHWTTVSRHVPQLETKQMIDRREVWARDQKGGRRVGTLYSIPAYSDTLTRRRAIPDAAVTPAGHVLYIGRSKRIMTKAEAETWAVDFAKIPASGERPSVTHARVPRSAPLAEMQKPSSSPSDEAAVLAELLKHSPATGVDARDLLSLARKTAPMIPIDAVVHEVADIAARKAVLAKKGDKRPLNVGWFLVRIEAHVAKWQTAEAARARELKREADAARDARLNRLAGFIADLAHLGEGHGEALPDGETERQFLETAIAGADPAELETARELVANRRAMRA